MEWFLCFCKLKSKKLLVWTHLMIISFLNTQHYQLSKKYIWKAGSEDWKYVSCQLSEKIMKNMRFKNWLTSKKSLSVDTVAYEGQKFSFISTL